MLSKTKSFIYISRNIFILSIIFFILITTSCSNEEKYDDKLTLHSLEDLSTHNAIIDSFQVTSINDTLMNSTVVYQIRYESDDCEVVGYIGAPIDYMEQTYPILVYNRGGNREFSKLDPDTIAGFASSGYIVLGSQYRGVDGGTGMDEFGGADVNDVISMIDMSEDFAFAQKGGVYMIGHSRGGMMTYMACRIDDRIQAAVILSGPTNIAASYYERGDEIDLVYQELIGGSPEEIPDEYEKRSAVMWADEINTPLLIIHGGDADWRVHTSHGTNMASELKKSGKEYKLIIYEDADHTLAGTDFFVEMQEWFREHPIASDMY